MSQQQNPVAGIALGLSALAGGLNALFGAQATSQNATQASGDKITLRNGMSVISITPAELGGRNLAGAFSAFSDRLGGLNVDSEDVTFRDTRDGVVNGDIVPQAGHEYVATISRDTKGC